VPVSRIRAVTARRLTESQAVPHFFLTSVVDVERLVAFRAEVNASLAPLGTKVSLNDLFVRASAVALRAHPEVNASWGDGVILRHTHVNVGVAVATDDGLLVPVVTDADQKSLGAIATETRALAGLARTGGLSLAQMSGGTFTISNLGMFGIDSFTAVLNPPEAGILAIGAASDVPAVRDGVLVTVPTVKITLTVDHRVLDGAVAAAFLRDLTTLLEEPLRIVL
jgi:pyruvate dehydrogenase E2 component (dihydrolipoamide acetyltransferase)